jgi:Uncharacterized protein conserved in bacteria
MEKELYVGTNWINRLSLPGVEEELVDRLEHARIAVNTPIIITSGVRSKAANVECGGASNSLHLTGGGADGKSRGIDPWGWVEPLNDVTFKGTIGRFGIYHRELRAGGGFHLDIDTVSPLRRFVKVPILGIISLDEWVQQHFPGIDIEDVPAAKANALLGF